MKKRYLPTMRTLGAAFAALAVIHVGHAAERIDMSQMSPVASNSFAASRSTTVSGSFGLQLQQALQLDIRNTFHELRKKQDKSGKIHTRYQQFFEGVPVYGEQVIAHGNSQNSANNITGHAIDGLENDLDSSDMRVQDFSSADAMDKAKKNVSRYMGKNLAITPTYRNEKIELVIFLDSRTVGHDAWYISYVAEAVDAEPVRPFFIIDADDGSILKTWNGIAH